MLKIFVGKKNYRQQRKKNHF